MRLLVSALAQAGAGRRYRGGEGRGGARPPGNSPFLRRWQPCSGYFKRLSPPHPLFMLGGAIAAARLPPSHFIFIFILSPVTGGADSACEWRRPRCSASAPPIKGVSSSFSISFFLFFRSLPLHPFLRAPPPPAGVHPPHQLLSDIHIKVV